MLKAKNIRIIPLSDSSFPCYYIPLSIPQRSTPAEVRVIAAGASLYVLIQCVYTYRQPYLSVRISATLHRLLSFHTDTPDDQLHFRNFCTNYFVTPFSFDLFVVTYIF